MLIMLTILEIWKSDFMIRIDDFFSTSTSTSNLISFFAEFSDMSSSSVSTRRHLLRLVPHRWSVETADGWRWCPRNRLAVSTGDLAIQTGTFTSWSDKTSKDKDENQWYINPKLSIMFQYKCISYIYIYYLYTNYIISFSCSICIRSICIQLGSLESQSRPEGPRRLQLLPGPMEMIRFFKIHD